MRKLKKPSLITISIILFVALISSAVTAGTLYTLTREAKIIIVSQEESSSSNSTYLLKTYSDPNCTQEITSFDLGSHSPGESFTYTIYIKNLGEVTVNLTISSDQPGIFAAKGYVDYCNGTLDPGEVGRFDLYFNIMSDAEPGTYTFNIYIHVVEPE